MMRTVLALAAAWVLLGAFPSPLAAAEEPQKVRLKFAGLDLVTLARQVERVTKKSFLFEEGQLRAKRVTLESETPISPDEFYRVFQAVLQMNGFVIVPVEGAGIALEKIVKAQGAQKEPGVHPILTTGDAIPQSDQLISFLIQPKHATTKKLLAVVAPTLSPAGTVTQVPNTDLILLCDVASSIKRVEKLLGILDVPGAEVISADIPVVNLPASKAQGTLKEYLTARERARSGEAGPDKLTILVDERLNLLHLIGPQEDVTVAREFLARLDVDAPAARRTIRYYKLKNVPVLDIVGYVGQLLGLALAKDGQAAAVPTPTGLPEVSPPPPLAAPVPPPITPPVSDPPVLADGTPRQPERAPRSPLAGQALILPFADIIPVEGHNMLVVAGDERVHEEVESILQNLDQRKGQVLIEVAIVQVSGDDSLDFGVEALSLNDMKNKQGLDGGTGHALGAQADNASRGFPTDTVINKVTGAAIRYFKGDSLQILLTALATKSNVSIASQPLLLVNDNEQASFTTKVSEPTVTTSQGTATTNTSFAGFAEATTSLQITPHISPDGYLNLEITQTFEEFQGRSTGNGIPPPKVSNDATTRVTIPDRNTIVIGGFMRDAFTDTRSGVPGLMHIPGLGKIFSRTTKQKTASRLYLFVRPKILSAPDFRDLKKESELKKDDVERLTRRSSIKKEVQERMGESQVPAEEVPLDVPAPLPPHGTERE
ncbi:MAG: hypothetical protein HS116_00270 [Planctomycetes bacterium]|nr:hypothetical protein [Planctomycetota bacterium]